MVCPSSSVCFFSYSTGTHRFLRILTLTFLSVVFSRSHLWTRRHGWVRTVSFPLGVHPHVRVPTSVDGPWSSCTSVLRLSHPLSLSLSLTVIHTHTLFGISPDGSERMGGPKSTVGSTQDTPTCTSTPPRGERMERGGNETQGTMRRRGTEGTRGENDATTARLHTKKEMEPTKTIQTWNPKHCRKTTASSKAEKPSWTSPKWTSKKSNSTS